MNKTRWGIISTAKIGVAKVIPALQKSKYCTVQAIASRNLNKAQQAAGELEIPTAYGSYDELLADPNVDVIYNPLPNDLHVSWSIKALQAGKHVLCEKPIGLSSEEGQQLVDEGKRHPNLKLMEAFMYRFHPQWVKAKDIVLSGGIGDLQTIQSFFSYNNPDPNNIRNMPDKGGGGLMDIGCYNISLSRFIFDAEPQRVFGYVEFDPNFKTDRFASGMLQFEKGLSTFTCATQLKSYQRVNILGDEGRVEIDIPFNAPPDRPCTMRLVKEDHTEEIELEICDQYTIQGDLFAEAVLEDKPVPTPIEDSVANMKVIGAVFESAKQERWVKL